MSGIGAPLVVMAPAKLTVTLRVLGTRRDGYHDLEALTVMIGRPCDRLRISDAPAGEVTLRVLGVGAGVPTGADNLVVRAARAALGADAGLAVDLIKEIPVGGGLGGGSADAAAVLRVFRDRAGVSPERVQAVAAGLGSDVPVCVDGRPVMMRGRGEQLERVSVPGDLHVVVAMPRFGVSTPAVFGAWDDLGGPSGATSAPPAVVAHLVPALVNDLEAAAEAVEPRLGPFRAALEGLAGVPVRLAGSGSSCWWPATDRVAAAVQAARVRDELGVEAFAAPVLRSAEDDRAGVGDAGVGDEGGK